MATALGTYIDSHQENFCRMNILIVDFALKVLQDVLQKELIKKYPNLFDASTGLLCGVLSDATVRATLFRLPPKVFNQYQRNQLYPNWNPCQLVTVGDLDITLTVLLLRNVTTLNPRPGLNAWDNPSDADTSTEARIGRVKRYRNVVYAHAIKAAISDQDFRQYFSGLKSILLGLSSRFTNEDYDVILFTSLDAELLKKYQDILDKWHGNDKDVNEKMEVGFEELTKKIIELLDGQSELKKLCLGQVQHVQMIKGLEVLPDQHTNIPERKHSWWATVREIWQSWKWIWPWTREKTANEPSKCTPECTVIGTRSLTINWEPAIGDVRYYEIKLTKQDEPVRSKKIPRYSDTEVTFDKLDPGTEYGVIVVTKAEDGHTQSERLLLYTDPDAVGEIKTEEQERSAKLSWERPTGNWEVFRISVWKNSKQDKFDVFTDTCAYDLSELEPGEKYFLGITTLVNSKESKEQTSTFVTVPAMISEKSIHKKEGVTYISLKWRPPAGRVDKYFISVKQENQGTFHQSFRSSKPDAVITNITPGIAYTIEIQSCSYHNQSEPCCIQLRKSPAPPTLSRNGVTVTTNKITLCWDLPQGKFERYQIFYKKQKDDDGDDDNIGECYSLSAGKTYVINDLEPSTHYTGWIRTLSKWGEESEHVNFDCFTEPEPPQDFSCLKDSRQTTQFTLAWKASRGDIEGYTLIIRDTDGKETQHKLEPETTMYKVEDLIPGMMYRCTISTTSQAGVISNHVECRASTVPEAPIAEFITIKPQDGVYVVFWERPLGIFKEMSFEYSPTDNKKDSKTVTAKVSPSPPLSVSHGTVYDLHAFSVTDHDKSDPCILKFTTAPTKPVLYPQMDIKSTSVAISWEPVQTASSYEVSCEQAGIIIRDPQTTQSCIYWLNDLLPATKYDVKIATSVQNHEGKPLKSDTSQRTVWTNPSIPTDFKQIWSKKNKKRQPTSFKLKWDTPKEDIDHFEIIYDAYGVGRNPVRVECSRRTAEIFGLEAGTKYNCSISAVLLNGQRSEKATCIAYTAPGIPGLIIQTKASTKGLYLQWMPASGAVQNHAIMYRNIQETGTDNQESDIAEMQKKQLSDEPPWEKNQDLLDKVEKEASDSRYEKITTVHHKCNLENLVPGTNYEIRIFAIAHDYPSLPQQREQATKPGKPGEVTKEETLSAESILLSWGASEGNVTGYEIEYGREDRTLRKTLSSSAPNCIIDDISPGLPYSFKVYAVSNGERGVPSQFIAATDLPCPENFKMVESKSATRSIELQWDAPPSIAAGSWSYVVKHRRFGSSDKYQNDLEVSAQKVQVTGLVPGRKYEFSLQVTGWKDAVGFSTSTEVFCTGATDPEPVHGLMWDTPSNTLTWEKPDGDVERFDVTIQTGTDIKTYDTTACRHTLQHVKKGEPYVFSVVAISNGKASKKGYKHETIAPGNPEFVKEKIAATTTSITLQWTPPGGKVKHYVLHHRPVDEDMGWVTRWWSGREKTETVETCCKTVENLNPGMKYRFKVFADVDGARDEKGDVIEVVTEPEKPSIEYDLSSETLVLLSTCTGWKDSYEVTYKSSYDNINEIKHFVSKAKDDRMKLLKWQPGRLYDVEVKSISYFGTDMEVQSQAVKLTIYTAPSKPEVNYEVSTNSLKLSWSRINEPGVNKITVAYMQGGGVSIPLQRLIKDVSATSTSIYDLQPGTLYQAWVTFHCGDKWSSSSPIDITTDPVPPETIYATSVSTSTADIEWDKPNGQYDYMIVTLTDLTSKEACEKQIKEVKHYCSGLHPASWYRLSVETVKGSKRSAINSHDFCTAPLPPKDISVNLQADTANIQWEYPNKREDDGIRFEIKYWEVNTHEREQTVFSETLQTTLESLTPGAQYKVQVRAVFQGTKNDDFKERSFITEPPSVTDVHLEGFTNYADVSWRPPVHGIVKSYDIVCWPADNPSAKRKTKIKVPAIRGSIEGLKRGNKYIVVVRSIVEGCENQGADQQTFYTVPSQPSMGSIETTPDSIDLKWSRKEDEPNVTEAIVTYWQPGSTQQTKRISTRDPQQLLISPLKPNTCIEGSVELVCGDKTSDKTHWSATTDSQPIATAARPEGASTTATL